MQMMLQYLIDFCLIIYNIITIIIDITAINDYCFLLYIVLTEWINNKATKSHSIWD